MVKLKLKDIAEYFGVKKPVLEIFCHRNGLSMKKTEDAIRLIRSLSLRRAKKELKVRIKT